MMEIRISNLCRGPKLREIFRRAEGGGEPMPTLEPVRPRPILEDAAAAAPEG